MQEDCPKLLLSQRNFQYKAETKFGKILIEELAETELSFKQHGKRMTKEGNVERVMI
jgi:hypothetical protein